MRTDGMRWTGTCGVVSKAQSVHSSCPMVSRMAPMYPGLADAWRTWKAPKPSASARTAQAGTGASSPRRDPLRSRRKDGRHLLIECALPTEYCPSWGSHRRQHVRRDTALAGGRSSGRGRARRVEGVGCGERERLANMPTVARSWRPRTRIGTREYTIFLPSYGALMPPPLDGEAVWRRSSKLDTGPLARNSASGGTDIQPKAAPAPALRSRRDRALSYRTGPGGIRRKLGGPLGGDGAGRALHRPVRWSTPQPPPGTVCLS